MANKSVFGRSRRYWGIIDSVLGRQTGLRSLILYARRRYSSFRVTQKRLQVMDSFPPEVVLYFVERDDNFDFHSQSSLSIYHEYKRGRCIYT